MKKRTIFLIFLTLFILAIVIIVKFDSFNFYKSTNQEQWNKNEIMNTLESAMDKNISWSPDNQMVIFVNNDNKKLMIWNIGDSKAKIVSDDYGFLKLIWSPDSSYFLACAPMDNDGNLIQSTIIKAKDQNKMKFGLVSGHFPVWSFNSEYLATDGIETDKNTKWSDITILSIKNGKPLTIMKSKDNSTIYQVKYWNNQNVIGYSEKDLKTSKETEKTIIFNSYTNFE